MKYLPALALLNTFTVSSRRLYVLMGCTNPAVSGLDLSCIWCWKICPSAICSVSLEPLPKPTTTDILVWSCQEEGSTSMKESRSLKLSLMGFCTTSLCMSLNRSVRPVSPNTRAMSSIRCCAAVITWLVAIAEVLGLRLLGSSPCCLSEIPVRFSAREST